MGSKKKLIALISYNLHSDHMNYGAALHTFAFQQYMSKYGVESVVIDYVPQMIENRNFKYPVLNNLKIWHPRGFARNVLSWGVLGLIPNVRKYNKFQHFFLKYYKKTANTYSHSAMMQVESVENLDIDTFVCESDVIWKLYGEGDFNEVFFLNFPAVNGKRKIAYSPSIGSRPFNSLEKKRFTTLTRNFSAISCREREGAEYLSKILERKVEWVLDPTMLLNDEDYSKIAIEPKERHYLLVYNCMVNDKKMLVEAQRLANRLNLELIEISNYNINKLKFKHKVKTDVGIEEWLGYFKYADFVVCNAFHGCCFSVIFKRQFFLFQRDKSDFRMKSITDGLGLFDRMIPCDNKHIPETFSPIDYEKVEERLKPLLATSKTFIKENIIDPYNKCKDMLTGGGETIGSLTKHYRLNL